MSQDQVTKPLYDWSRAKRVEPSKPDDPVEREAHCEAIDPKRCDFPDCPCGWP